ncbi:MAG: prolyl-tRNA synthetase associated domain-containing protein [Clostridiales bacterium]|nr:prolyl-tRNA synthetase associated domain-containing protein [Clostridiales bacterium]
MRKAVYDILDKMEIEYEVSEHAAVFTIEEMDSLGLGFKGEVLKNLFLRDDKKRSFYILVMCKEKRADLKALRTKLNSRPLTFASEESLGEMLKLHKGGVTPFGIVNDTGHTVKVVFDKDIFGFERIGVHPNDNSATVWISPNDLRKVVEYYGNETHEIEL